MILKKADKGSKVVASDNQTSLGEVNRQLTDENFSKKLDSNPTEDLFVPIPGALDEMYEQ